MIKKGKLYGIGVGVGDPEMLTLKAIKIFKELDVVVLPEAKVAKGSTAYNIAKEYLKEEIELLFVEFSMSRDIKQREIERDKNSEKIFEKLAEGKKVGFLTIGDPMTYSTYIYLLERLKKKIEVETIAGITSFADITSRLNIPLVIGEESVKIISVNENIDAEKEINSADNIVFMKINRGFDKVREALEKTGNLDNIFMICNSGKGIEKIWFDIRELKQEDIPYFTTLILKKGGVAQWRKFIL